MTTRFKNFFRITISWKGDRPLLCGSRIIWQLVSLHSEFEKKIYIWPEPELRDESGPAEVCSGSLVNIAAIHNVTVAPWFLPQEQSSSCSSQTSVRDHPPRPVISPSSQNKYYIKRNLVNKKKEKNKHSFCLAFSCSF